MNMVRKGFLYQFCCQSNYQTGEIKGNYSYLLFLTNQIAFFCINVFFYSDGKLLKSSCQSEKWKYSLTVWMNVVVISTFKTFLHVQKYFGTRQMFLTHDKILDIYAPWNMMSTSLPSARQKNKSASAYTAKIWLI